MKKYIFLLLLLTLNSCYKSPIIVDVDNVEIDNVIDDSLTIKSVSSILNRNAYKLKAEKIYLKFYYNDSLLGKSYIDTLISLKGKQITKVGLDTKMSFKTLSRVIPEMTQRDSFPIKIHMKARFSSLKIPISFKTVRYININDLISSYLSKNENTYKIKNVKITSKTLSSSEMKVEIEYKNTFPLNYKIIDVQVNAYDTENKDNLLGTSQFEKEIEMKRGETISIPINISINHIKTIKGVIGNLFKKKMSIFLESNIKIEVNGNVFNIPFETDYDLPIPKF